MRLNEVTPELAALLPPTDSRRRGDIRALENGLFIQAPSSIETMLSANLFITNS